jgi:hypothetical protein
MSSDGLTYYLILKWWIRPNALYYKYDNFCVMKIKYIMYNVLCTMLLTQLYVRVVISLTSGQHLHEHLI